MQPDMKGQLSAIARILGPRGLMPNPKLGTLVEDVAGAVRTLKQGRIEFRCCPAVLCGTGGAHKTCMQTMLHHLDPCVGS